MSSSGTVSNPVFTLKAKPFDHRELVVVAGSIEVKSAAVIEAPALELRTIRSFMAMPSFQGQRALGTAAGLNHLGVLQGSITLAGSLENSVSVRVLRGSVIFRSGTTAPTGTVHFGTRPGGSMKFSFLATGA